jgi:hypothetical protein
MWAASASAPRLVRQAGFEDLSPTVDQVHGELKWSHGGFLYMDAIGGLAPSFQTLDREGKLLSKTVVSVPQAGEYWPCDFDRGTDGTIVFVGGTYSASGQAAPFIAWISPSGQTEQVVRTFPYYANHVSIAPDGSVWTIGLEMINHHTSDPALNPSSGVLRHFNRQGKLTASVWPQADFTAASDAGRLTEGKLIATSDRVGWYSSVFRVDKYLELSIPSMTQQAYPGLPRDLSGKIVDQFALTEAGGATVMVQDRSPGHRTTYQLDRATSQWIQLQVPALGGYPYAPHLLGSDGESLVFQLGQSVGFFKVL